MASSKKLPEPSSDLYAILDDAGLTSAQILGTKVAMTKIVEAIRNEIVSQTKAYMEAREAILTKERKNAKVQTPKHTA